MWPSIHTTMRFLLYFCQINSWNLKEAYSRSLNEKEYFKCLVVVRWWVIDECSWVQAFFNFVCFNPCFLFYLQTLWNAFSSPCFCFWFLWEIIWNSIHFHFLHFPPFLPPWLFLEIGVFICSTLIFHPLRLQSPLLSFLFGASWSILNRRLWDCFKSCNLLLN